MKMRSKLVEAPSGDDSSSGTRVSQRSEEQASEEGFARDEDAEVPEYERLRQENIKKNSLKLEELGVLNLAANFKSSTITSEAAGGEGHRASLKATRNPSASSLEKRRNTVGYLNRKP